MLLSGACRVLTKRDFYDNIIMHLYLSGEISFYV